MARLSFLKRSLGLGQVCRQAFSGLPIDAGRGCTDHDMPFWIEDVACKSDDPGTAGNLRNQPLGRLSIADDQGPSQKQIDRRAVGFWSANQAGSVSETVSIRRRLQRRTDLKVSQRDQRDSSFPRLLAQPLQCRIDIGAIAE